MNPVEHKTSEEARDFALEALRKVIEIDNPVREPDEVV